jgi:hypothetical protein
MPPDPNDNLQQARTGRRIEVPVTFFSVDRDVEGLLHASSDEVALVLVDTWTSLDPERGEAPSDLLRCMRHCLDTCRANGVTIIHAPNHPVVDRYPQYHAIRDVVAAQSINGPGCSESQPHLNWPGSDNPLAKAAHRLRHEARAAMQEDLRRAWNDRDISRFLRPLDGEFVLCSHDEFRYVLWKRGITLLLYMGVSLAECMQHRDTGISALAGTDSSRSAFTIVVLADCSAAGPSHTLDAQTMSTAMLDFLSRKAAFVSQSTALRFSEESQPLVNEIGTG